MGKQLIQTPICHLLFQRHLDFFLFSSISPSPPACFCTCVICLYWLCVCSGGCKQHRQTFCNSVSKHSMQIFHFRPNSRIKAGLFVTECRSVLSVSLSLPVCAHVAAWLSHVGSVLGAAHGEKFGSDGGVKLLRVLVDSLDASGYSVATDRATSPSIACNFWSWADLPVGSCKRDVQLGRGGAERGHTSTLTKLLSSFSIWT